MWLCFWWRYPGSENREEEYFLEHYFQGMSEEDILSEAREWAIQENSYLLGSRFQFGVDKAETPPEQWMREKLLILEKRQEAISNEILTLKKLLSK